MNNYNSYVTKLNKKHRKRQIWMRILSVLMCITVFVTTYALILPAITMDTSDPSVSRIQWGEIEWDDQNNVFRNLSVKLSTQKDTTYTLQYSDDNGATWTAVPGISYTNQKPGELSNCTLIAPSADLDTIFQSAPLERRYRVYGKANKTEVKTASCGFLDLLEVIKAGFREWVAGDYLTEFGGLDGNRTAPSTKEEYLSAFDDYYHVPFAKITVLPQETVDSPATVTVAMEDVSGNALTSSDFSYQWQYYDETDSAWKDISGATGDSYSVTPGASDPIPFGGAQVRCTVRRASDNKFVTRSENKLLNPQQARYTETYQDLDTALALNSVYSTNGTDFDFTHNSSQWNWAYFDAVAKDPAVPFSDKDSYWNYLCKTYLLAYDEAVADRKSDSEAKSAAAAAAKAVWDYYLYDIVDPAAKNTNYGTYYTTGGFGDQELKWVKTNDNDASFHYTPKTNPGPNEGLILPLTYQYLDGGVDYDAFIRNMSKYAEADAAGDGNSERKYTVDMAADAHAQVKAPIVLLFQVQTSWQLFDLEHANALAGEGGTEVGAVANNTELATLYDVKHAMLDFINYIDKKYPGNNLVLGVTEVRHGGSDSMFNTTFTASNGSKASLYVSNNPNVLRDAVTQWDIFGNCEHVHYDNKTLTAAVSNLGIDLSDFRDKNNNKISYSDIRKAVIIIGGPTENSNSENGYNCILPWSSFASADIDSVYGIRVNNGTSRAGTTASGTPILSWLDNDGNNSSVYKDGNGAAGFTDKYVCTTRQMLYDTFVEIAEKELAIGGIDILDTNANVDNVILTDTVRNEFQMDLKKPFRITVTPDMNNTRGFTAIADLYEMPGTVKDASGNVIGTVTKTGSAPDTYTITYTTSFGTAPHPTGIVLTSNADGTTKVEVAFNKLYNTQKAEVNFGIQAKEGYIGSNNVFTNVGVPTTSYSHTLLSGETRTYTRLGTDNPQVNVPIDFTTDNGSHKVLYRDSSGSVSYDIALNDAGDIPATVQALVDDFGQINGTLVYQWVLPDGTKAEALSTKVTDGKVQGGFPNLSQNCTFTSDGFSSAQLLVSFVPDDVNPKGEFHDVKTKTEVTPKTRPGAVTFQVVSPNTKELLTVKKNWVGSGITPSSITFKLLYEDETGNKHYYTESGAVREFELTNNSTPAWTKTFEITPTSDGKGSVYEYTAVEAAVEGYSSSIEFKIDYTYEYQASAEVYFTPQIPNSGNKVVVHYTYHGLEYTQEFTDKMLPADTRWIQTLVTGLPTEENGTPYAAVITKVDYVSGNDTYTVFKNDIDPYDCTVTQVGYPVFTVTTGSTDKDKIGKGKTVRVDYKVDGISYHAYYTTTGEIGKNSSFTVTGTKLLPPGTAVTDVAAYWGDKANQNTAISSSAYRYLGMRKQNVTFKTPIALAENKIVEVTLRKVVPTGETAPEYTAEYTVPKNGFAQGSTISFEFPDVLPDGEYYLADLVYKVDQNAANDVQMREKTTVTFITPLALTKDNQVRITLSDGTTGTYPPPNAGHAIGSVVTVELASNPASGTTVTAIEYKSGNNWLPLTAETRLEVTTPLTLAQNTVVTATLHDNTANKDITATYTVGKNEGAAGSVISITAFKEGNNATTLDYTHSYTVTGVTYKVGNAAASPLATPGAVSFTVPYGQNNAEINAKGKDVILTVKNGDAVVKTITAKVENKDHKSGSSVTVVFAEPIPEDDDFSYELSVKIDNTHTVEDFSVSCGGTPADTFLTVGGRMPDAALYIGGSLPENKVISTGFNTISVTMDITEGIDVDAGVAHTVYYVDEKTGNTGSFTVTPVVSGATLIFTNSDAIPAGEYTVTNITRTVSNVAVPYYNDLNAYLKTDSMLTNITATSVCGITNTPIVLMPSTGGHGTLLYVITGLGLMAGSIVCGYILRRKRERRDC